MSSPTPQADPYSDPLAYPYADPTAPRPDQGLNPVEEALIVALAAYLASSAAVSAVALPPALVGRLTSMGLAPRAVRKAGRLTLDPPLTGRNRWGSPTPPTPGDGASLARMVAADEPIWRARYLMAAARRLTAAIARREFTRAVTKERRYLRQHRAAGQRRRAGAQQADRARARSRSGLLVWEGGTCPDCEPRNGRVFRPGEWQLPPLHNSCGCYVRPLL